MIHNQKSNIWTFKIIFRCYVSFVEDVYEKGVIFTKLYFLCKLRFVQKVSDCPAEILQMPYDFHREMGVYSVSDCKDALEPKILFTRETKLQDMRWKPKYFSFVVVFQGYNGI